MEKYTIDIDKVLDEFEETEALKIHADKSKECIIEQHLLTKNYSNNFDENIPGHTWVEAAYANNLSPVDASNTQFDLTSNSNSDNRSFSQENVDLDEHLNSISHCTVDKESNFNGTNNSSAGSKPDLHCEEDINAKQFSYDIFYKSKEPDLGLQTKIMNSSMALNCVSELFSDEFNLEDYNPDEILCIAVEDNKPEINVGESQVNDIVSSSAYDSTQSNDFGNEESQSNTKFLKQEVSPHLKTMSIADAVEVSEKVQLNQSKLMHISQTKHHSLSTDKLSETLLVEGQSSSEERTLPSPLNYLSLAIENVQRDVSKLVSGKMNTQSDSPMHDNCCNHIASTDDNLVVCSNLEVPDINEMQVVQLGNQNPFDVCIAEVPRNALDLHNGLSIQDDDSGVSSTEDISGNSPPQINSGSANSAVNENCDIEVDTLKMKLCKHDNSLDVSNSATNFGSSNAFNVLTYICEEKDHESLYEESSIKTLNVALSSLDENTVSKLNYSSESCSQLAESGKATKEFALSSESVVVPDKSIIFENINKEEKIDLKIESDETSYQFEISRLHLNNLQLNTDEVDTSRPISSNSKNVETSVKEDLDQNRIDDVTVECTEELNLTLESSDSISPRLQRPTTLNLPSLLIVPSHSADDGTLLPSISFDAQDIPIENSAVDPVMESETSEMNSYMKQQTQIGIVKPYWIPDAEALSCMHCEMKFTVLKRRHHCRGCGKVLCSKCCNQKAFLAYLNKEDRICQPCAEILTSTLQNDQIAVPFDSQSSSSCGSSPNFSPSPQMPASNYGDKNMWRPHPNNPDDYCSTIPPLQQIMNAEARPPPTVMVPIGVLKRGNKPRKEPKKVIFSDGIRPGGDLTDLTEPIESAVPVYRRTNRKRVDKFLTDSKMGTCSLSLGHKVQQKRIIVSDGEGPLPPLVLPIGNIDNQMDWSQVLQRIMNDNKAVNFALMKNLYIFVKITNLDCCFGNECWCFTSHGLCTVGQDEVMIIMERLPGETNIPRDILKLFSHVYDSASKGATFDDLGHIIFPEQILGSNDHRGFLFVRPTFQCLSKLTVPNTPYLVAILIHKWEVPWAKVFPLRLMLRLGAECRYYPCSLVSVRYRKPVYFEIGQTIMSVLADLRNYQFTIPVIPGLVVHMEEKKTSVNIPSNRYEKVMKILNNNNVEHVLALGSNFSTEADSHLVCMQKEEGDYQTQAINIENTTRKVTGASFIIFSGALKSTSGLSAKFSIVEDGLLIQISQETMVALHMALRDMKDMKIECGQINAEPEETVLLQWTRDDKKFNIGVQSPIDGKSFEGIHNLRIHSATDYAGENYLIRWTEVFFLDVDENASSIQNELVDPCRLAETVAQSCCMALTPYLDQLAESNLTKLGLRVMLDSRSDRVEYDIGACRKALPSLYMNALDNGLIPVILRLSSSTHSEKVSFELIFHILIK